MEVKNTNVQCIILIKRDFGNQTFLRTKKVMDKTLV